MKQLIYIFILLLILSSTIFAQTETSPCPSISVAGGGTVPDGTPLTFTVLLDDSAKNLKLEYIWTISKGQIIEGQGSPTIKVVAPDLADASVMAEVTIKGLPENCANTASETSPTICRVQTLIDEFGNLADDKIVGRIEDLSIELEKNSNSQGYIINYGTNKEIAARERQIQKAIKCEDCRITIVNGGANPNGAGAWTKIWLVPPGAENPTP